MKITLRITFLLTLCIFSTGCINTVVGTVGGTTMGAPSLMNKLYKGGAATPVKVFATPFVIPVGIVGGFCAGLGYGVMEDFSMIGIGDGVPDADAFIDPFRSGLFDKAPAK